MKDPSLGNGNSFRWEKSSEWDGDLEIEIFESILIVEE
jgi:hypothetical protein